MSKYANPNHWNIPRVFVFLAIVSEGSISSGAKALGLSKGVASNHLQQLEQSLGARLFERSTRKLRLTEAGQILLPYAQELEAIWNKGLEELQSSQKTPTGTLCVTAPLHLAEVLVEPAIATFLERFPKTEAKLILRDKLLDVFDEKVDLAIRVGPQPDSDMIMQKLSEDVEVILATPKFAEKAKDAKRPEQLLNLPWVVHELFSKRLSFQGPNNEECWLSIRPRVITNTAKSMVRLIESGMGVGLAPLSIAQSALEEGKLHRILPEWSGRNVSISAVYPSKKLLPPRVNCFIQILKEQLSLSFDPS